MLQQPPINNRWYSFTSATKSFTRSQSLILVYSFTGFASCKTFGLRQRRGGHQIVAMRRRIVSRDVGTAMSPLESKRKKDLAAVVNDCKDL